MQKLHDILTSADVQGTKEHPSTSHHGACVNLQPKLSGGKQGPITSTVCCLAMWFLRRTAAIAHLLLSFTAETACQKSRCVWIVTYAYTKNSPSTIGSPASKKFTSPLSQQCAV